MSDLEKKKSQFLNYCVLLALLLAAFGFIRYYVTGEIEYTSSGTKRTLLDSTINTFIFAMCYVLFYGRYWREHKFLTAIAVFIFILGVNLSGHRSGWVVVFFVLTLYFMSPSFERIKYMWVPLFAIALVPALILLHPLIAQYHKSSILDDALIRIADTFELENKTTQERLSKWALSWEILKSRPVLGLARQSIHTTSMDMDANRHLSGFAEFNRPTHNLIATKIAHEGIIGLGVLLLFLYVIFRQINWLKLIDRDFASFVFSYFLAFILLGMFNPTFSSGACTSFFYSILGFLNAELIAMQNSADPIEAEEAI
jgi:O-antigen ligase